MSDDWRKALTAETEKALTEALEGVISRAHAEGPSVDFDEYATLAVKETLAIFERFGLSSELKVTALPVTDDEKTSRLVRLRVERVDDEA